MQDEPILWTESDAAAPVPCHAPEAVETIRQSVREEPFVVLCTQGGGQPYGSLVAFAFSHDLSAYGLGPYAIRTKWSMLGIVHQS